MRLADSGTPNIEAYDCYLRGREVISRESQEPGEVRTVDKVLHEGFGTGSQLFANLRGTKYGVRFRLSKPLE